MVVGTYNGDIPKDVHAHAKFITCGSVPSRQTSLDDIFFVRKFALITKGAPTSKAIQSILTDAAVVAWVRDGAVIDIHLAGFTFKACSSTVTDKCIISILANPTVLAWVGIAVVGIHLTVFAFEPLWAFAELIFDSIPARPSVLARA